MEAGLSMNCNAHEVPHAVYTDVTTGKEIVARHSFCTKTTQTIGKCMKNCSMNLNNTIIGFF